MYRFDHGVFTDDLGQLSPYLSSFCSSADEPDSNDCGITFMINKFHELCDRETTPSGNINWSIVVDDDFQYYRITTTQPSEYECIMCSTPDGILPDDLKQCKKQKRMECPPRQSAK
jgi:hypothetical protein